MSLAPGTVADYLLNGSIIYRVEVVRAYYGSYGNRRGCYLVKILKHEYLSVRTIGETFVIEGSYLQPVHGLRLIAEAAE